PHSYCVAKKDRLFHESLLDSNIILPDGSGITLAIKVLYGNTVHKYSGPEMHLDILCIANKEGKKVFYLGSSPKTLKLIEERLKVEYPNINVGFYSPPYKDEFTDQENQRMIDAVNEFNPDFLFVGMTAPKQEKWTYKHKKELNAKVICSIGAAFDFFAGTVKLPPQWIIDIHLQWLHRLCKEPKRMWRRNFISTPIFLWDILLYKLKIKK
ncbi:MAG: WecB/TagA/CpsF family glycosyltransferase, partial [Patescibacteria group bacterium]